MAILILLLFSYLASILFKTPIAILIQMILLILSFPISNFMILYSTNRSIHFFKNLHFQMSFYHHSLFQEFHFPLKIYFDFSAIASLARSCWIIFLHFGLLIFIFYFKNFLWIIRLLIKVTIVSYYLKKISYLIVIFSKI